MNSILDQEEPDPPQIKAEQEELYISQEGEQLVLKLETDTFMETPTDEQSDHSKPDAGNEQLLFRNSVTEFTREQLTAAVKILTGSEKSSIQYEEDIDHQRRLLETFWKPQIKLHRIDSQQQHVCKEEQLCNQERNSSMDQEEPDPTQLKEEESEPDPLQIKAEQEELCISQEGEQLVLKLETDTFMETPTDEQSDHSKPDADNEQLLFRNSVTEFTREQLTAAVKILTGSEKSSVQYEEDIDHQRRLLETFWKPQIKLHRIDSQQQHVCKEEQLCNQERNSSMDQEEPPQIKEEEPCASQEGEQLVLKPETDVFMETRSDEISDHSEPEPGSEQLLSHNSAAAENQAQKQNKHVDPGRTENTELKPNKRCHSDNVENSPMSENRCETDTVKKPLKCDVCGKAFKFISNLKRHHRSHTGLRPNSCETCGKNFRRQDCLLIHMRTHTGEKPYSCETCGKSFSQKNTLLVHMRAHTGEKPYSCETCGKSFTVQSVVLRHMRIHTGEKPYSCGTCGKSFSLQSSLLHHMRMHTGEKPYSCGTCGKSFSEQSNLLVHMRMHTGEKPYSCETCSKSFTRQCHLLVHVRSHTAERPFSCDICGKSFSMQNALLIHMRIHTGEKPYSCGTCGKSFSVQSNVLRHMRTHTGEKPRS